MKVNSNLLLTEKEIESFGSTLEEVQDSLTLPNPEYTNMLRFGKGRFYKKVDKEICYLEKVGSRYLLPRYYFGETRQFGVEGRRMDKKFLFTLRDYQQEFFREKGGGALLDSSGLLLEAPCGSGKTILGIYIALLRGRQTMVLVPTYYLAKQWAQRIAESTNATSVILKSTDTKIPTDVDFTIVVMDLFSCRVLPKELVDNIGHVILDEAHRVGAETYLPILKEIPAKFRTALTATFRRKDGVHRILAYHFGLHLYMPSRFPKPAVYGVYTGVTIRGIVSKNRPHTNFLEFLDNNNYPYHETKGAIELAPSDTLLDKVNSMVSRKEITKTKFREISVCMKKAKELQYATIDSYLNDHAGRRKIMTTLIRKCLESGRTVLFLSKRKDVLKTMAKVFAKYKPVVIVSETNVRTSEEEEYLQNKCPLILGVTQLAKEGLDIDRLDTLIIHLPMADTEQAIGRIARIKEGKKLPLAFYLLDNCPITYAVFTKAKKCFKINADYKGDRHLSTIDTLL